MHSTGRQVNRRIIECGVVPLTDFLGERIWFYPRGRLPAHVVAYLNIHNGRNAQLLRDYLVSVARGIIVE
jgi:hypothetical protein